MENLKASMTDYKIKTSGCLKTEIVLSYTKTNLLFGHKTPEFNQ